MRWARATRAGRISSPNSIPHNYGYNGSRRWHKLRRSASDGPTPLAAAWHAGALLSEKRMIPESITLRPIGILRTPFADRVSAPRQPYAAAGIPGTIELFPNPQFEHALSDLDQWTHIWVIFWFHLNSDWRPKVLPPRSLKRRGVFATRSPHRPNPIGISVFELDRIDGLSIHVRNVDVVDGTPVLDIKPYVPFADSIPQAGTGWLEPPEAERPRDSALPHDPEPGYEVIWSDLAARQAEWLRQRHSIDLLPAVTQILMLGPQPHPYRRIKRDGDRYRLATKEWRVRFRLEGRRVEIETIMTGYRPAQLAAAGHPELEVHRAFCAAFPDDRTVV